MKTSNEGDLDALKMSLQRPEAALRLVVSGGIVQV
ncbi:hypothetical protein BBFGKLBO_01988 [Synechococcus sp. CBW1107]|jgi:hypothetical protein|nr:hypothetical protein BBFGKLBO_01988 [Synechococcus sp. CBW1107]